MSLILRKGIKVADVVFGSSTSIIREIKKVDTLSLSFQSKSRISVRRGDYVVVDNETFTFCEEPNEKKNNKGYFEYNSNLLGDGCILKYVSFMFLDQDSTENRIYCTQSQFDLTATVEEFLDLICRNLKRVTGESWVYSADSSFDRTDTANIGFSDNNCLDALKSVCNEMELEWNIEGKNISVSKKIEKTTGINLSYPENLISPLEVKHEDGDETCTRLYVFGGERNIPSDYNGGKSNRLLMTGKTEYLQRQSDFIIEKVHVFDDIYPRRNSTVSSVNVSSAGFYFVGDNSLDFDINNQLTDNSAKITFNSGLLVGYEFEIASYNNSRKEIEIKQQTVDGVVIPNEYMCPRKGDKYVLTDIIMPDTYIKNAEAELYTEARKYFDEYCADNVSANVSVSSAWIFSHGVSFRPFQTVILNDDDLELNKEIRIVKVVSYPFDYESYGRKQQLTLADYVKETKLEGISARLSKTTKTVVSTTSLFDAMKATTGSKLNSLNVSVNWNG